MTTPNDLPPLPPDAADKTYVLVAMSGELRWICAVDDKHKSIHPVRVVGIAAVRR